MSKSKLNKNLMSQSKHKAKIKVIGEEKERIIKIVRRKMNLARFQKEARSQIKMIMKKGSNYSLLKK